MSSIVIMTSSNFGSTVQVAALNSSDVVVNDAYLATKDSCDIRPHLPAGPIAVYCVPGEDADLSLYSDDFNSAISGSCSYPNNNSFSYYLKSQDLSKTSKVTVSKSEPKITCNFNSGETVPALIYKVTYGKKVPKVSSIELHVKEKNLAPYLENSPANQIAYNCDAWSLDLSAEVKDDNVG